MKILTFNASCDWDSCDGINAFIHRAGMIYEKINTEKPDIIAFQEIVPKSLAFLKTACPDYDFFGQYRSEKLDGEGLFVAVRKELYDVTALEAFWLSETPSVPGSRFAEQSECPRICTVCDILSKENGGRIRIFNVHLDHISDKARILGINCVLGKISEYQKSNPLPYFLMGDFNSLPDGGAIKSCTDFGLVDLAADITCTYHEFGKREEKLDYIFTPKESADKRIKSFVWNDCLHGIYLSDHYPVGISL